MDRSEQCKRLAEWLGWAHFKEEIGFECLYWCGVPPKGRERISVPDFFTDPAASMELLEKMRRTAMAMLFGRQFRIPDRPFPVRELIDYPVYWTDSMRVQDPDLMTAIALAALALIKERDR